MLRNLVLSLVVVAVVVGAVILIHGGRRHHAVTTTAAAGAAMTVEAYFYQGAALVPVRVRVTRTKAVATAALHALLAGPPAGYRSAVPAGVHAVGVSISRAIATATVNVAPASRTAQAQIVCTLMQFSSIKGVLLDGTGRGSKQYSPSRCADYADLTPSALIFVSTPLRDSTVTRPVHVSGTAVAFEATIALEIWSGGKLLRTSTITASAGAPERGTWSQTLTLAPGSYRLVLYEPSAENGSHLHTTTVDFTVKR